jgi:hypothetical protein
MPDCSARLVHEAGLDLFPASLEFLKLSIREERGCFRNGCGAPASRWIRGSIIGANRLRASDVCLCLDFCLRGFARAALS